MLDGFSDKSLKAIEAAKVLAEELGDQSVATGHLIFGLTVDEGTCLHHIFKDLSVDPDMFSGYVKSLPREAEVSGPNAPFNRHVVTVLERAKECADELGSKVIDPEHVAIALMTVVLLGASLAFVSPRAGAARAAVGLGLAMGVGLLAWPGMLLQVAVVQGIAIVWIALAEGSSDARSRLSGAALAHGVALLLVAPFALGSSWTTWGHASPVVLSAFQPLWLGLTATSLGLCAIAWRSGFGATRSARVTSLGLVLSAAAVLPLLAPSVRAGISDATTWLLRRESFQAAVAESRPLLADAEGFTLAKASDALTPLVLLLPVMLLLLVLARRRNPGYPALALWCAVLLAAAVAQQRFANSFSIAWALAIGCCADLALRTARRGTPQRALAVGLVSLGVVVLAPLARPHAVAWATSWRALTGERVRAPDVVAHHGSLVEAASWLREHSPETAGWLDDGEPEYGVLTAWGDGHVVRYVARRPVVQDNFGDDVGPANFADAERYFAASDEETALAIATRLKIRYVLVREAGSGHPERPYPSRSMHARLHRLRGTSGHVETGNHPDAPSFAGALAHHRLLFESRPDARGDVRFKLFEIVAGARVAGRANPGALIEARLALASDDGRSLAWVGYARAGHEGLYELTLPFPTEPFPGQLTARSPWAIESEGATALLPVSEAAVREGLPVVGPTLQGTP